MQQLLEPFPDIGIIEQTGEALEYTTLSLEHAGDPHPLASLDKAQLASNLADVRRRTSGLLAYAESTSENMMQLEKSDVPGQLAFSVVALRAHGLEPGDAARAGFEMETWGRFSGPFLPARKSVADEYRKLWAEQPSRDLPFRYGYPDASGQNHMVITRPRPKPPAEAAGGRP